MSTLSSSENFYELLCIFSQWWLVGHPSFSPLFSIILKTSDWQHCRSLHRRFGIWKSAFCDRPPLIKHFKTAALTALLTFAGALESWNLHFVTGDGRLMSALPPHPPLAPCHLPTIDPASLRYILISIRKALKCRANFLHCPPAQKIFFFLIWGHQDLTWRRQVMWINNTHLMLFIPAKLQKGPLRAICLK